MGFLSGCSATRPEAVLGADLTCGKNLLAKIGEVREALDCHIEVLPGLGRYAGPPLRGVLLWWCAIPLQRRLRNARESLRARRERDPKYSAVQGSGRKP